MAVQAYSRRSSPDDTPSSSLFCVVGIWLYHRLCSASCSCSCVVPSSCQQYQRQTWFRWNHWDSLKVSYTSLHLLPNTKLTSFQSESRSFFTQSTMSFMRLFVMVYIGFVFPEGTNYPNSIFASSIQCAFNESFWLIEYGSSAVRKLRVLTSFGLRNG